MHSKSFRRELFAIALAGTIVLSGVNAFAADTEDYRIPAESYDVPTEKGEYLDMGFTNVDEESFLYIRSEATRESEWVGKLYPDYAVKIKGPIGEWTKIESGELSGYVKTEYIITGDEAQKKAEELILEAASRGEETKLPKESVFRYAEVRQTPPKEEAEPAAVKVDAGQAVVDFASQFIGNPYVWGGTSLTNGADCSGFVQAVYANFGVKMPRTSGEMRNVGTAVSFEEAKPGDVFCYSGHVGIYIGNGQIINAIDEAHGIGISSATYANIITIRRLL